MNHTVLSRCLVAIPRITVKPNRVHASNNFYTNSSIPVYENMTTEENILEFFEREKGIKLPSHIKNLLIFTGFDNKLSLSKMESDDIAELEKIGREIVPCIIETNDLEKYLGHFKKYPQGFTIFPGHKKILHELSQFYRNFSYKKRSLNFDLWNENSVRKRNTNESNSSNTDSSQYDISSRANNRPRDVDSEKQNIYTLLTNWISNFCSRNLSVEETNHVNKELPKLKVDISHEDPNQCFVTCCICLRELKIFRNQNGFWIMSNIHKHFKTHLNIFSNKKFSKNISLSSSITSTMNQEVDFVDVSESEIIKQEAEFYDEN